MKGEVLNDIYQTQVDTATKTTVTPYQYLLHNYHKYTKSFQCPNFLVAALNSNDTVSPLGEGLLHIPSEDKTVVQV